MSDGFSGAGGFVWFDLITPDAADARRFYPAVFDWTAQASPGDDYVHWKIGDRFIGGMPVKYHGSHPNWVGYVSVADVDVAASTAKAGGGRIVVPPNEVPRVGRFCVVTDPWGAAFALFAPADGGGESPPPVYGQVAWNELATGDIDAALTFYADLFGWRRRGAIELAPGDPYVMFGGDHDLGGMFVPKNAQPAHWLHYVQVPNIDVTCRRVVDHGGAVLFGPTDPGRGKVAGFADPQGATFAAWQPRAI